MAVTPDDVRRIATLARLRLDDARVPALTEELNGILGHMDVLSRVDTTGVAPTAGAGMAEGMRLRDDVVAPIPLQTPVSQLTAESRDGFILVPRLATHGDVTPGDAP